MTATGTKRLMIEFITRIALDAAKADGDSGSLVGRAGAQLANLGRHAQEAKRRVYDALAAVRSGRDYDPAKHGQTDDEIADWLCAGIDARRASEKPHGR